MKLTKFSIVTGSIVGIVAGVMAIYIHLANEASNTAEALVYQQTTSQLAQSRDLTADVLAVKFDVVQVQQFLTDVSATRGLNGLDDGYANAEGFAQTFEKDIAAAKSGRVPGRGVAE